MTPAGPTVTQAKLERTSAGTPYSSAFQDIYHSSDGGLAQARHVFLAGNSLPSRWADRDHFTILETGFGLGLNFLAAWHAWREDPRRCARLHFVSIEKHPFPAGDLSEALAPFAEIAPLARALCAVWPAPLAGFHRLHFDGGAVHLTLVFGDARSALPSLEASADALFLDGFAPARNPEIWSPDVIRELARASAPGATLATWTVAGGVRTALADAGFVVEKREGFGTKREMLVGRRGKESSRASAPRRATVVGAGLAGTLVAERLASRGWHVDLLDARERRSAAEVGLVRPIANLRDAVNARLSRSAFLFALQHYRALQLDGYHLQWQRCGVLQLARDEDEAARFAAIAAPMPAEFMSYVDPVAACDIARRKVTGPAWWFPGGAVVGLESLAVASQARAGTRVTRCFARHVDRIEREGHEWRALDEDGRAISASPVLILANAVDALRLHPAARLRLSAVRGQVTYLPPDPARSLEVVVSGNGYIAPRLDGGHGIGASYQHDDPDAALRIEDHRANLARAESMLPGFTHGFEPAGLAGWVGFRATVPDRLPIFGETSEAGLYIASGLGSRGLLWAPLGAELLASALEGEPLPLPRDLAGAVSPRRFLS